MRSGDNKINLKPTGKNRLPTSLECGAKRVSVTPNIISHLVDGIRRWTHEQRVGFRPVTNFRVGFRVRVLRWGVPMTKATLAHVSAVPDGATCALRRRSRGVVRNVWMGGVYNLRRGGEACVAIEQGKWG
jgi:hypothetical protein